MSIDLASFIATAGGLCEDSRCAYAHSKDELRATRHLAKRELFAATRSKDATRDSWTYY